MDIMNPDQPLVLDDNKVARFKANNIVRYLLDQPNVNLNDLATVKYLFSQTDWDQFYQLIGYSVSGYGELSGTSKEAVSRADAAADTLQGER